MHWRNIINHSLHRPVPFNCLCEVLKPYLSKLPLQKFQQSTPENEELLVLPLPLILHLRVFLPQLPDVVHHLVDLHKKVEKLSGLEKLSDHCWRVEMHLCDALTQHPHNLREHHLSQAQSAEQLRETFWCDTSIPVQHIILHLQIPFGITPPIRFP